MRSKASLAAFIVAVFMGGAATTPSSVAAPPADACLLLNQAQLSAALAVSMAAGSHTTPEHLKTCTWVPSGGPTQSLKFVTLDLRPADGFENAKMRPALCKLRLLGSLSSDHAANSFSWKELTYTLPCSLTCLLSST